MKLLPTVIRSRRSVRQSEVLSSSGAWVKPSERDHVWLTARHRVCGGRQISSTVAIEREGHGEGNGRSAARRPRRVRRCRNRSDRLERGMARARALEEEPVGIIESTRQVLGCEPASLAGRASERSPTVDTGEVVPIGQAHARSKGDSFLGHRQWDRGTSPRSHPRRRGTSVQRCRRRFVTAVHHPVELLARLRRQAVAHERGVARFG